MRRATLKAAPADILSRYEGSVTAASRVSAVAPHVDGGEEEEPHHVDEVPVPGGELEGRVAVLVGLNAGEDHAQDHREPQAHLEALAIILQERVVRPGDRGAGG